MAGRILIRAANAVATDTRPCVGRSRLGVLERLLRDYSHAAKDFWERADVIASKDESLTKCHVRYLESRLIKLAQDPHRAKLTNDTAVVG